jgi:hypothetical protein
MSKRQHVECFRAKPLTQCFPGLKPRAESVAPPGQEIAPNSAYLRAIQPRPLQVDYDVALRLGAADQQVALGGRLERFGLVVDTARD